MGKAYARLVPAPEGYPGKTYTVRKKTKLKNGSVYEYTSPMRYVREQWVVWWSHYKKLPPEGWVISFKNGDPHDCRIENLYERPFDARIEKPLVHGISGYGRGCRCDVCKNAKAEYTRKWRLLGGRKRSTRKKLLTHSTKLV